MTEIVEIFVGLLIAVAVIALLARELHIPYPILFLIGGLLIGWLIRLDPELPKVRRTDDAVLANGPVLVRRRSAIRTDCPCRSFRRS